MIKIIYTTFFVLIGISSFAQDGFNWREPNDEELAVQFYQKGEFEKAIELFKDLTAKNKNLHLYDYYVESLIQTNALNDAEKYIKNVIKDNEEPRYKVDLASVYIKQNDKKNAEKQFDEIENNLLSNEVSIQTAASALNRKGFNDKAISIYQKGRKLLDDKYVFSNDLAELFGADGNIEEMTLEYLKYLLRNPLQDDIVKTAFAKYAEDEANYNVIKEVILKEIQAAPNSELHIDLLSWLFISKKEFMAAYVQLKSLDKRNNESGKRLVDLAAVSKQNRDYRVAKQCYNYVKSLGERSPYYYQAYLGELDMQYLQITELGDYNNEEVISLKNAYLDFVKNAYAPFREKYKAYLKLAEIEAVYLDELDEAIAHLEQLENSPQVPLNYRGEAKIALGNYYLLKGDVWEASLKYSQVEKLFKDNPLGHKAKFLNAKLSFYRGEFEWSKAQLDILKGSTSELIANDALQLSMLITDNWGLDTISTPLQLYANADKFLFMNKLNEAELTLDTINQFFPNHSLDDEILLTKARIETKRKNYQKAVEYYEQVYTKFASDILADDALYEAANILQYKLLDNVKAKDVLEKLILEYKSSVYSVDAAKRYRLLRDEGI